MKIYSIKKSSIKEVKTKPFRLEKDIQNLVEKNLGEFFEYELIKSEFVLGGFRIDSLCYDKHNKSVVIIEYKKGKSYSVIDQGFSYLSNILENKSDIILEIQDVFGRRLKKNEFDWSSTKVIFISPSFSTYQKESINFQDLPIELYEITQFENNSIGLNEIVSRSSSPSIKEVSKDEKIKKVSREVRVHTEEEHLQGRKDKSSYIPKTSDETKELYFQYKNAILNTFDNVKVRFNKYEVVFQSRKPFLYFYLGKDIIKIWFNMKKGTLDDSKKICRDVSAVGHWGTGDYELNVSSDENFEYIMSLVRQSYELHLK
jgi:predicted transport protein